MKARVIGGGSLRGEGTCSVCGTRWSSVWLLSGKRLYCAEHVPSRKTLRRKVRELRRGGPRARSPLGNATSADTKLPKAATARSRHATKRGHFRPPPWVRPPRAAGDLGVPRRATLRLELVLCGKGNCKKLHGPYWYAYWKDAGRTQKRYVGKRLPHALAEARERAIQKRPLWRRAQADERVLEELELGGDDE